MKIKTSELAGPALDWAVAKCEGEAPEILINNTVNESVAGIRRYHITIVSAVHETWQATYSPSTNWAQGGPIIEREDIHWGMSHTTGHSKIYIVSIFRNYERPMVGPTPLIAAMRCYCYAKLGDEVEIPDELMK